MIIIMTESEAQKAQMLELLTAVPEGYRGKFMVAVAARPNPEQLYPYIQLPFARRINGLAKVFHFIAFSGLRYRPFRLDGFQAYHL